MSLRLNSSLGEIHLCRARYNLCLQEDIVVDLFCQYVVLEGCSYAWIDGVNFDNPVLVPIEDLIDFRREGTLGKYLRDDRHLVLGGAFNVFLDMCLRSLVTPTTMVRACEFMHFDCMTPDDAIRAAIEWGELLEQLDTVDRSQQYCVSLDGESCS